MLLVSVKHMFNIHLPSPKRRLMTSPLPLQRRPEERTKRRSATPPRVRTDRPTKTWGVHCWRQSLRR